MAVPGGGYHLCVTLVSPPKRIQGLPSRGWSKKLPGHVQFNVWFIVLLRNLEIDPVPSEGWITHRLLARGTTLRQCRVARHRQPATLGLYIHTPLWCESFLTLEGRLRLPPCTRMQLL